MAAGMRIVRSSVKGHFSCTVTWTIIDKHCSDLIFPHKGLLFVTTIPPYKIKIYGSQQSSNKCIRNAFISLVSSVP